jgi:hypothetical protein
LCAKKGILSKKEQIVCEKGRFHKEKNVCEEGHFYKKRPNVYAKGHFH